jgi:hypothetical protein
MYILFIPVAASFIFILAITLIDQFICPYPESDARHFSPEMAAALAPKRQPAQIIPIRTAARKRAA